jgi:hypothetical protein
MKKFIKVLSVAFVLSLGVANADDGNGTQIRLKRPYPVGGAVRPSRCLVQTISPVEVFLDFSTGILTFIGNTEDEFYYILLNEEGDAETSGTCVFDDGGEFSTSLGMLQDGTYSIVVLADGVEYFGTFEIV